MVNNIFKRECSLFVENMLIARVDPGALMISLGAEPIHKIQPLLSPTSIYKDFSQHNK